MGLGILITLVGFIGSVALLFGLVWYLMTLGGEESDANLIAQNKANPLQKKAKGKDLRPWAAVLVLGGFLSVSTTTIFVFSSKSATDSLNQMFSAVWEIEAKPSDFLVTVEEEEILDPPPSEPPPPPPPPTVDNVVISEEKIDTVIAIDTTAVIIEPDIVIDEPQIEDDVIVDVPQQKACFKDADANCGSLSGSEQDECCQKAILTYLAKVEYPTQAKDLGVEGKVLLRFVVEKDGSISQIEKVRGDDMLAAAAIRHIKNSGGKWVPGQNNGESVRSRFVAPFTFKLR